MAVRELTESEFDQAASSGLVVVDFWAPWCGPCMMIAPLMEELSGQLQGKASFYRVNIDEHKGPAVKYQVMSIPTLLVFKDGKLVDRIVGALPKDKMLAKLQKHL
ncbi:MAG: thioredoxin [Candidatus Altiarchaeota archaeon]